MSKRLHTLGLTLVLTLGAASALAVGTRRIELRDGDDFRGGDLVGVAVDSRGQVRAGFNLGNVELADVTTVWSGLPRPGGGVLLGTGNEGKLLQVDNGGAVKVLAASKALALTSMVEAWKGVVLIGTLPDGIVMKWDGKSLTDFVALPQTEHVWDVAYDDKAQVAYAATGPEGKLYRIDAAGKAQVYFDAEEEHLMSVAVADGRVYAGASDKAKLYQVSGPGRASVVYDFARTEVRKIAVAQNGDVYAIANEIKPGSHTPTPKKNGEKSAGPSSTPPRTKGRGVLYRFSPDGTPEKLLEDKDEHYVSLTMGDDDRPYVGTGAEGRIYTVDDTHNSVLVADTEERQVGAMWLSGANKFVATGDPAVFRPVRGVGGADAVWTSRVLDAGLRAHFGRIDWTASGTLELSTRTGNTEEPDDTWSPWSAPLLRPDRIASPSAQYLQVRARFNHDRAAVLHEVSIPFVTDNLRAILTEVEAESVATESATNGKGSVESSGGPITKRASTKVSLSWKVDNPDRDELRYRLQYRLVGTDHWYEMLEPREQLTKTSYSWQTEDLPEGRYRVRVTASDELANPPAQRMSHELESNVVLVDNTPPTIQGLALVGRLVRGTALDGVGPIARIEISVAGTDEWAPFHPRDGVFDQQREDIEADVSTLVTGGRLLLSIRVYDQAGNFVVRNLTVR